MNFRVFERRERRSMLNQSLGFGSIGYTIANYSTDTVVDKKIDIKPFEEKILNTINSIPDPLRKNLADTVITSETPMEKPEKLPPDPSDFYYPSDLEPEIPKNQDSQNMYTSLQGISSFFTNFFGALAGSVFSRRARSPVTEYYDCYDSPNYNTEMSPPNWQTSNVQDLNKNSAPEQGCESNDNMNNYRTAVAQCEQKLNVVKGLLPSKNVVAPPKFRRKPRKMFVEPGTVQENAEDTFSSDNYVSLPNAEFVEYVSVRNNHNNGLAEIHGDIMKTEAAIQQNLTGIQAEYTESEFQVEDNEIIKHLPESDVKPYNIEVKTEKSELCGLNGPIVLINGSDPTLTYSSVAPAVDIETPIVLETKIEGQTCSAIKTGGTNYMAIKIEGTSDLGSKTNESGTLVTQNLETPIEIETSITEMTENEKSDILSTITEELHTENKVIQNICEVSTKSTETKDESSESEFKTDNNKIGITKEELISSVEDKMAKLKLLFQEKKKKTYATPREIDLVQIPLKSISKSVAKQVKPPTIDIITEESQDKKFKNPHRSTDKRKKTKLRQNIRDDMKFAHEINSDDLSSVENSPRHVNHLKIPQQKCSRLQKLLNSTDSLSDSSKSPNEEYFDELKGRFHTSSTTESEDSFQIVFTDSPRTQRPSDCESEDSFIVFEDRDSCYTTNDVFGDHEATESECSDSEVSDSGCGMASKLKLSHNMSRTISDLTDESLYEDVRNTDEIDCTVRTFEEIPIRNINVALEKMVSKSGDNSMSQVLKNPAKSVENTAKTDISSPVPEISSSNLDTTSEQCQEMDVESQNDQNSQENLPETDSESVIDSVKRGLLLDEERKRLKKNQPKKSVSFSAQPPKVHVMRVWAFAARQARAGHWERHAVDRERFKRRIADTDVAVSWVLKPQHRRRIMFQRFMPWWNHLKRLEIAEKKRLKEEEEQRKKEDEQRMKEEEERRIKEEEERLIREEEEKVKEEERRLLEEEEHKRREAEGIVDNKEENTNGVEDNNDELKTANVKPKIKNTNFNKPMSAYLKQKKKIVLKNPNSKCNVRPDSSNVVPKSINIDDIVVGQHKSMNHNSIKKPIINIDDIVVGKHNTKQNPVKTTAQNITNTAVPKPIKIEDFIGKSNQSTVKAVTQKLSEKIVNDAK